MKALRVFTNPSVLRPFAWARLALLLVGVLLLASFPVGTALGSESEAPLAYVTQRDATPGETDLCSVFGSVSVIDTTTNQVLATVFEVGPGPHGMAITSNGKKGYVANYGSFPSKVASATCLADTVSVLRLLTKASKDESEDNEDDSAADSPKVVALVKVGPGPLGVAITPNDREVYVTNFGADPDLVMGGVAGNTVSVINTRRNEVVATIPVGNLPAGVAITPNGRRAYVPNRGDDTVSVINTRSKKVVDTVAVQDKPANVILTPDGSRAYVTNFGSNTVSVIDTATNTVVPVPNPDDPNAEALAIKVGLVPIGLAITPDGARVYVVNVNFSPVPPPPLGNVSVIDTATNMVVPVPDGQAITVGPGPRAVAITPDGAHAYVTNFFDDTLSVIDTDPSSPDFNTVVATVGPVAGGPNWVTITDRNKKAHKDHD